MTSSSPSKATATTSRQTHVSASKRSVVTFRFAAPAEATWGLRCLEAWKLSGLGGTPCGSWEPSVTSWAGMTNSSRGRRRGVDGRKEGAMRYFFQFYREWTALCAISIRF